MVFGTFDGLHDGHLDFFKQARKLAAQSFLIASVARNKNVIRIKGKRPALNEQERMALIKKCHLVDKAVLSGVKNHLIHIISESPDIIALGYDQKVYVQNLKKDLKNKGLNVSIVRLKPYRKNIFKNKLINSPTC